MSDRVLFCRGPGRDHNPCGLEVSGHGEDLCSTHRRQASRNDGKLTPIAEKMTPEERAIAAGTAMLEADSDEEYDSRRRAWISACKEIGGKAMAPELLALQEKVSELETALNQVADDMRRQRSEEVKRGLSAARARGVRIGRPPKVSGAELLRLFALLGSGSEVARVLEQHPATINERLARLNGKRRVSSSPSESGPRPTPEST